MKLSAVLALGFFALSLQACGSDPESGAQACSVRGRTHADGESWTCADGCNTCTCDAGQVVATDALCNPDTGTGGTSNGGAAPTSGGALATGGSVGGDTSGGTASGGALATGGSVGGDTSGGTASGGALATGGSVGGDTSGGTASGGALATGGSVGGDTSGGTTSGGAPVTGGAGSGGAAEGGAAVGGGASCTYGDQTYADGEVWTCSDGCNTCGCVDGSVGMTALWCTLSCTADGDCTGDQYCYFTEGSCGGTGTCTSPPNACDTVELPVCGCDGRDYGNACRAAAAGVSVASTGACTTECGGWAGDTCTEEEYCAYQPGDLCGAADAQAVCQTRPELCTEEYLPVCGCDGVTYGNACAANAAGTGIYGEGACSSG